MNVGLLHYLKRVGEITCCVREGEGQPKGECLVRSNGQENYMTFFLLIFNRAHHFSKRVPGRIAFDAASYLEEFLPRVVSNKTVYRHIGCYHISLGILGYFMISLIIVKY